ncbi:MAG: hypothetical protein ABJC39_03575 [Chloroflexota bacterium]
MVEARWLRWFGPGAVALGALGLIASTTIGAGVRPWMPGPCAGPPASRVAAARDPGATAPADVKGAPWFRLDPVLAGDGGLTGQRLAVGIEGQRLVRSLDLASEAFAAGPFGRFVVAGSDDGGTSRLQAIDVDAGCAWALGQEASVIRRATVDPTGTFIYEMRVDRDNRADLGIWRRSMDGSTLPVRVLPPIADDARFGRTFSTELTWDTSGDRLAVQSCGEAACRVRIVAPGSGPAMTLEEPDLGPLVGVDGDRVVTYEACRGLPCPIVSTDLRNGDRRVLAPAAGHAVVVVSRDGSRLVHEDGAAGTGSLRAVDLEGTSATDLGRLPAGLRLAPSPVQAAAATRLPIGWVLLAADGRLPIDGGDERPQLRHVPDGSTVTLDEALR